MNENEPSKFWVVLILKLGVALLVHLVENIKDEQFLAKTQNEVSGINGRIKKKRDAMSAECKPEAVKNY